MPGDDGRAAIHLVVTYRRLLVFEVGERRRHRSQGAEGGDAKKVVQSTYLCCLRSVEAFLSRNLGHEMTID